jgi:hypothetical protein
LAIQSPSLVLAAQVRSLPSYFDWKNSGAISGLRHRPWSRRTGIAPARTGDRPSR